MSNKQTEYFNRFVNLFTEIETLTEDVKQLSEEVKESGVDIDLPKLKTLAKLKAQQKLSETLVKYDALAALADELGL